jgi:hypothetical protein
MNYFFMPATHLMSAAEGAGGLFDFNATLPLIKRTESPLVVMLH